MSNEEDEIVKSAISLYKKTKTLAELEKEHIIHVMDLCGGNKDKARKILGIARGTLFRKLGAWGLLDKYRQPPGFPKGRNKRLADV